MTKTRKIVTGGIAAAVLGFALAASAQQADPAETIKYRQNVMKGNGAHSAAIAAVVQGKVAYSGQIAYHAAALAGAAKAIPDLFPAGSDKGAQTAAKAEVWQKGADFKAAAATLEAAANKVLVAANANNMDGVKAAWGDVGKACGGCHETFRVKQN